MSNRETHGRRVRRSNELNALGTAWAASDICWSDRLSSRVAGW